MSANTLTADNGVISGTSGIKYNGGNDGTLQLQTTTTGGTATTALTINNSQNVGIGTSSPGTYAGFKTLALNGTTGGVVDFLSNGTREGSIYNAGTSLTIKTFTASPILFATNNAGTQLTLDTSGNLGLGVTPSAWGGSYKGLQISSTGAVASNGSNATGVGHNYYYDGTNNKYLTTGAANLFLMINNEHRWYTAPSGTAGNNITFTQAMTLDASGRLGIGPTSPTTVLHTSSGVAGIFAQGTSSSANNLLLTCVNSYNYGVVGTVSGNNTSGGDVYGLGYVASAGGGFTPVASWTSSGNFAFNSGYGSAATAYGCRAWVNFNGTGTVAIRASGNVSSITDNGTGKYTVNFTTAMSDANYAYSLATVAPDTSGVNTGIVIEGTNTSVTNKTTTQLNIVIGLQTANTYLDKVDVSVLIFR
jgi:hypothetical protein